MVGNVEVEEVLVGTRLVLTTAVAHLQAGFTGIRLGVVHLGGNVVVALLPASGRGKRADKYKNEYEQEWQSSHLSGYFEGQF